MQAPDENLKFE